MKFILNRKTCNTRQSLINRFHKLYLTNFPDDDEREDFATIINNICNNDTPDNNVLTFMVLMTATPFSRAVSGGMVVEFYKKSRTLTIPYITVDNRYRNKKIATRLIHSGIMALRKHLKKAWHTDFENLFLEVNDPMKNQMDNFNPYTRLYVYKKIGFRYMPVPHIQPAFPGKKEVHHLILLTIPDFSRNPNKIAKSSLIAFYQDYFKSFDIAEDDFDRMINKLCRFLNSVVTRYLPKEQCI